MLGLLATSVQTWKKPCSSGAVDDAAPAGPTVPRRALNPQALAKSLAGGPGQNKASWCLEAEGCLSHRQAARAHSAVVQSPGVALSLSL